MTKKKKTAKRRKTSRKLATRRPARARKGYAFMIKIGDDYLTANGDYSPSQADARRFSTRPNPAKMPKIAGDRHRPRVVSLHLRQS